ncbi:MAG: TetR family transcriptional regulator C-terminal domain-containing protein [Pseudomonadota bacterium]
MPRVVDPEQRRTEVVCAAFSLLARDGVEALTMRAVAQEAGCTIGLLNHWFNSKDHLVEAALEHAVTTAIARCKQLAQDPETTLEQVVSEFLPLDSTRTDELRVWLAFWALSIGRSALRESHRLRVEDIRTSLTVEISKLVDNNTDVAQFVDVLMALLDGITVNALVNPEYWTTERQRKSLLWALKVFGGGNTLVC